MLSVQRRLKRSNRYEREINRSSRSAIKRIQEHDSSPAQPMILVVSQVFWSSPALNDFLPGLDDVNTPQVAQAEKEVVGMELTDGWYRIIAKLDPVLAYAAKRGKIAIGTKIAMTGCKVCHRSFVLFILAKDAG